jgi:hypothetical protein
MRRLETRRSVGNGQENSGDKRQVTRLGHPLLCGCELLRDLCTGQQQQHLQLCEAASQKPRVTRADRRGLRHVF